MSNLLHVLFAPVGADETVLCAFLWFCVVAIVASYSPRLAKRNLLNPNQYGDDE